MAFINFIGLSTEVILGVEATIFLEKFQMDRLCFWSSKKSDVPPNGAHLEALLNLQRNFWAPFGDSGRKTLKKSRILKNLKSRSKATKNAMKNVHLRHLKANDEG